MCVGRYRMGKTDVLIIIYFIACRTLYDRIGRIGLRKFPVLSITINHPS
jgi:hypothetical protein